MSSILMPDTNAAIINVRDCGMVAPGKRRCPRSSATSLEFPRSASLNLCIQRQTMSLAKSAESQSLKKLFANTCGHCGLRALDCDRRNR